LPEAAELRLVDCPPPRHFPAMVKLCRALLEVADEEFGPEWILDVAADPVRFQSLACLLGYERNTSGSTTVVTAALREAADPEEHGVLVVGGKGKLARRVPEILDETAPELGLDPDRLKEASLLTARSDTRCLQDGHDLYHHVILVSVDTGRWVVVQQGMNVPRKTARRYHWKDEDVREFVEEHPVHADEKAEVLSLQGEKASGCREAVLDLISEGPRRILRAWSEMKTSVKGPLDAYIDDRDGHPGRLRPEELPPRPDPRALETLHEIEPVDFTEYLRVDAAGPSLTRALALIAEFMYGEEPDRRDPAEYTTAFGCKSGDPYPVDPELMELAAEVLEREGSRAVKRLLDRRLRGMRTGR